MPPLKRCEVGQRVWVCGVVCVKDRGSEGMLGLAGRSGGSAGD